LLLTAFTSKLRQHELDVKQALALPLAVFAIGRRLMVGPSRARNLEAARVAVCNSALLAGEVFV
jgi:hypothetical protein